MLPLLTPNQSNLLSSIIYISSRSEQVSQEEIDTLLQHAVSSNIIRNISGILIYKDQNFFQILEGETAIIRDIYTKIVNDKRHHQIFKLSETQIQEPVFKGYQSSFSLINSSHQTVQLKTYIDWIKLSENPEAQKAITILEYYLNKIK